MGEMTPLPQSNQRRHIVQIIYPVGAFALMFLPMLLFYFDQESRPSGGRSLRKTAPYSFHEAKEWKHLTGTTSK
jgi:hypothetical protein